MSNSELYGLAPDCSAVTRQQSNQPCAALEDPSPAKHDHQTRILLVEDEAMIAMSEQMELELYGYQVVVAGTGEEAVEICGTDPEIDLILMDIDLGAGMSGPETATQILKAHQVPVVFLSSHTDRQVVALTEKISSYGYVVKNLGITVLDASIKMALRLFQANVRLECEKEHLQTTLNSIGEAVITTDTAGRITRINPIALNLTGWSLDDALGKPIQEVAAITSSQTALPSAHPVHAAIASGAIVERKRPSLLIAKGRTEHLISVCATPMKGSLGEIIGAVLTFRDITEESRMRLDRKEEEHAIAASQRAAKIGSYKGDFVQGVWETSEEMDRIAGIDATHEKSLNGWFALIHPEDVEMVKAHMQEDVIGQRKPFNKEYRQVRKSDGEIRWLHGLGTVTFDSSGNPLTMIGTIQDITEVKELQDRLRETQERLFLFMQHSPVYTYLKEVNDRESRVLLASESFVDLIGIPGSQMVDKSMEELFPSEFAAKMTRDDWAVVSGNQALTLDEEFNGRHYTSIKFPITQGGRKLLGGYTIDITEMKHAEEALRRSEETHRSILETAIDGFCTADAQGRLLEVNESYCRMSGYSAQELQAMSICDLEANETRAETAARIRQIMAQGEARFESRHRRKDGCIFDVDIRVKYSPAENTLAVFARDISERKLAEVALSEMQTRLTFAMDQAQLAYWEMDAATKTFTFNDRIYALHGTTAEREGGYQMSADVFVRELLPPDDRPVVAESIRNGLSGAATKIQLEHRILRRDGELRHVLVRINMTADDTGRIIGACGCNLDITERKLAEEQIKALLAEKDRLLEEVHHRIKNNMYAVKNLLTIQASTVSEAAGRGHLLEAASRVQSMMLLYDSLLHSSDYLSVSIRPFLSSLADAVVASFSGNVLVTIEKEIEDCLLRAGKTQPLGLILNEVLTNSMKHAFVGRACGKVAVTFHVSEGRGVLEVQDDGKGMPDSIDFEKAPSLGLKLIQLLAKQIGGTVRVMRRDGTTVIVEFPM